MHVTVTAVEAVGVAVLLVGIVATTWQFLRGYFAAHSTTVALEAYRRNMGKAILLGLEFLVVADIIYTTTVHFTLYDLSVLGLLVLIRTFLSFSLEVEIEGRWPWQARKHEGENL